ncbi:hypothetical protein ACQKIE_00035 [Luteibacter sp. NPDC031894]|uniref:hypothetical protein n=1 Tax=Luteibacter sp. NPDC031894 TaxID=3390572 RepID=UPI003CFE4332
MQGALQEAELQNAILSARANRAELQAIEAQAWWQDTLSKIWVASGLDGSEATHLAASYRISAEQAPILDRARRDGVETTIQAAHKAYQEYNYQLANQLMVAAYIVNSEHVRTP